MQASAEQAILQMSVVKNRVAARRELTAGPAPRGRRGSTGEHAYLLTMAVAGFSPSELDITVQENTLLVTGKAPKEKEKKNGNGYLHRGIAGARSSCASASPIT